MFYLGFGQYPISSTLGCKSWWLLLADFFFQISRGHTDLLDRLSSAYEEIGDELPLLEGDLGIFEHQIGFQSLLGRIFADVLTFHADTMKIYSGRGEMQRNMLFKPC